MTTDSDEKINTLKQSAIFRDLPLEALNAIALASQDVTLPRKTLIFRRGDPGDSVYIISSGKVRIFTRDENGMEVDLSVQGAGESFGEMALLTGEPRSADVQVLENAHLLVLAKEGFDRILREHPEVSKIFMKEMRRWLLRGGERIEIEAREAYRASRFSWRDFVIVVLLSVLLAVGFNYSNPNGIPLFPEPPDAKAFPQISPATALEELNRNETLILDAMPNNFYQKRHIKGAVNMPLALFDIVYMMTFDEEDKDKKVVVYGRTISKAYDLEVANKLLLRGYNNVRILEGGVTTWEKLGFPIEEGAKK